MFNPVQTQRGVISWLSLLATVLTVFAALRSISSLVFYALSVLVLQFFFNQRRVWLVYAPALTLLVTPLVMRFSVSDILRDYSQLLSFTWILLLLIGGISELVIRLFRWQQLKKYTVQVNQATEDNQLFFNDAVLHAAGLNDTESSFFKKEVRKHYVQYQLLISLQPQARTLIPSYTADLQLIDQTFRELVNAPKQMLKIDDFLYRHLPDYVQLVTGLVNMADNAVQTDADKAMLAETKASLATYQPLFTADYLLVTENERQQLQKQLKTSK